MTVAFRFTFSSELAWDYGNKVRRYVVQTVRLSFLISMITNSQHRGRGHPFFPYFFFRNWWQVYSGYLPLLVFYYFFYPLC